MNLIATKFVSWQIQPLTDYSNSTAFQLRSKLNNGGTMTREEKDWLARNVHDNTYFKRGVSLGGYCFDFSDVLHAYIVKQYGRWTEYFAPDKTSLRKILYGTIEQIIETH